MSTEQMKDPLFNLDRRRPLATGDVVLSRLTAEEHTVIRTYVDDRKNYAECKDKAGNVSRFQDTQLSRIAGRLDK